jgi:hypothetical protein
MFTMETTPTMFANDMLRGMAIIVVINVLLKFTIRGGNSIAPTVWYWFPNGGPSHSMAKLYSPGQRSPILRKM